MSDAVPSSASASASGDPKPGSIASATSSAASAPPPSNASSAATASAARSANTTAAAAATDSKAQPKPQSKLKPSPLDQLSQLPPHLKLQILSILQQQNAPADSKDNKQPSSKSLTAAAADAAAAAAPSEMGPAPVLYSLDSIRAEACKRLSPTALRALQTDGYVVLDNVLGAETCTALHTELTNPSVLSQLKPAGMRKGWKQSDTRGYVTRHFHVSVECELMVDGALWFVLFRVCSDKICWLHSDDQNLPPRLRSAMAALDSFRSELNASVALGCSETHTQLALYDGGGARYVRHSDTYEGGPKRRLTLLYYINPNWVSGYGRGCSRSCSLLCSF
jgi:Rps23 Pro-64 3,4-dihydroxylase Tpa1-like proline 4-hydroxylase